MRSTLFLLCSACLLFRVATAASAAPVPGQWATTDSSAPDKVVWPSTWIGAKNLRAQWFKILADDPQTWVYESHCKGEPPGNTYYLWRGDKPVPQGTKLLIEGDFPHCRFFDIQVGAPWDPKFPMFGDGTGIPEIGILDEDIVPDPGHSNPFLPGADRTVKKRHFHVTLELRDGNPATLNPRAGAPPYRAAGNLRIGGTRHGPAGEFGPYLWIRVFLPDGYDRFGGVAPPVLRIQYPGQAPELAPPCRRIGLNNRMFLPLYSLEENPALDDGTSAKEREANAKLRELARTALDAAGAVGDLRAAPRFIVQPDNSWFMPKVFTTARYVSAIRLLAQGKIREMQEDLPPQFVKIFGMGKDQPPPGNDEHSSDHNNYCTYLLASTVIQPGQCFVIRGRLPRTPRTLDGRAKMEPSDELRYLNFTFQAGKPTKRTPVVSISDEELFLDRNRGYTIVISRPEDRPQNATAANGVTWRPWPLGDLLAANIRVVSTAATTWEHAPQRIGWDEGDLCQKTFDRYAVRKRMGEYYPDGRCLSKAEAEALGTVGSGPFEASYPPPEGAYGRRAEEKDRPAVAPENASGRRAEKTNRPAPASYAANRSAGPATAPVSTTAGPITGEQIDGVRSFKGIPYAAPPLGALRWKPPVAPQPWTAPRACVKYGPACPQGGGDLFGDVGEMSEDCLTLNVWTAARSPSEKRPVMVWIHGGGFMIGASGKEIYDGSALARKGVVLVSMNYRLGPFGFLAHPALTAESPHKASGNYGLMDQIFALHWIKANIDKFGGDPGNVTVFGQSAGGVSVCALMCSPLAKGLFQRGIAESGAPPTRLRSLSRDEPRLESAESLGVGLAERLGVGSTADVLEALRAKPWREILKAVKPGSGMAGGGTTDHLIVDGFILPEAPGRTFLAGRQMPISFMAGTVTDEGTIFLRKMRSTGLAAYNAFFDKTLGPLAARAKPLYPAADDAAARRAMADFVGDGFVSGVRLAVRASAAVQPKTFLYQFARMTRPMANSDLHCFHGAEIPYVFGLLQREKGYDESDRRLSEVVMGCWVRFAQNGDPNGDGAPAWPAYNGSTEEHLILDLEPKVGAHLRQPTCDFFDALQSR